MNDGMIDIYNIKPERVSFLQLAGEKTKPQNVMILYIVLVAVLKLLSRFLNSVYSSFYGIILLLGL